MKSNTSRSGDGLADFQSFDPSSGTLIERLVFNHRIALILLCLVATVVLGIAMTRASVNASFEKMIPQGHPYIQNYLQHKDQMSGLGNTVRIVVQNPAGDIFDPGYLEVLRRINDEVFLIPGVDRAWMKSLWTPATRWSEITEEGFQGGPVMPDNYDATAASIEQLRVNIARAGLVGTMVANDFKSTSIFVPLLEHDPRSGEKLDYWEFASQLEQIRAKYETGTADPALSKVSVHIVGFAKVVGDILDGLSRVGLYFLASAAIAVAALFAYTRCIRSTLLVLVCSLVAVIWQIGLVTIFGFEVDPYSMLVPFLVFAIGISHGAQKMNGIGQDIARGAPALVAARFTFRRLFLAGVTALLADAVGFGVLMVVDIPVIKELALTASVGVAALIFTNLLLLPVLLSYTGVAAKETVDAAPAGRINRVLVRFAEDGRWAGWAISVSLVLGVVGFVISLGLKTGDLDPGAPELRPDSRYNRDDAYIRNHYALSTDIFAVMLKTAPDGCSERDTLVQADRLGWAMRQVPQVQSTMSLADAVRQVTGGSFEGNPKWQSLSRNQDIVNYGAHTALRNNPSLANNQCSLLPVSAYLADHKAETLDSVVAAVEEFARTHANPDIQVLPAAGSAGIEAATNIVVREANRKMLLYVYAAVIVLCFITFRSWRAVIVAVVPLVLTSILCEALMVVLGIGVKVATLPVVALGVGIGVDYALYLISMQLAYQRAGATLPEAFDTALRFTGTVVALVGFTLAAGVITWAWSPIKFQADMGILLAFMFLWNMVSALVLVPALSRFLLNGQRQAVPAGAPSHA